MGNTTEFGDLLQGRSGFASINHNDFLFRQNKSRQKPDHFFPAGSEDFEFDVAPLGAG